METPYVQRVLKTSCSRRVSGNKISCSGDGLWLEILQLPSCRSRRIFENWLPPWLSGSIKLLCDKTRNANREEKNCEAGAEPPCSWEATIIFWGWEDVDQRTGLCLVLSDTTPTITCTPLKNDSGSLCICHGNQYCATSIFNWSTHSKNKVSSTDRAPWISSGLQVLSSMPCPVCHRLASRFFARPSSYACASRPCAAFPS